MIKVRARALELGPDRGRQGRPDLAGGFPAQAVRLGDVGRFGAERHWTRATARKPGRTKRAAVKSM